MFLPDRYVRGTCPRCGAADQYGDSCEIVRRHLHARGPRQPGVGGERHAAGAARLRAPVLQARRLRADAARVDRLRAACSPRSRPSSTSGSAPGCATGTSRATRPTSASRSPARRASSSTSGSTRRSATSAACCSTAGARAATSTRYWRARQRRRGLPLHRQGHRLLPHAVLAGRAARRGLPPAHQRVRARLPDRERPEDVEVARHVHHRAHLARPPAGGVPALLLRVAPRARRRRPRPEPRRLREQGQFRPRRQARQHREPLRRFHRAALGRPARRRAAGAGAAGVVRRRGGQHRRGLRGPRLRARRARGDAARRPRQPLHRPAASPG